MDIITKLKGLKYLGMDIITGSIKYALRRAAVERKFKASSSGKVFSIGAFRQSIRLESGMRFVFENAELEIVFVAPGVPRLTWTPGALPLNIVVTKTETMPVQVKFTEKEGLHILESDNLTITVALSGDVTFDLDGNRLRHDHPPIMSKNGWKTRADMAQDEAFFGMGMKSSPHNVRGQNFKLWNMEPQGAYAPGDDPLYVSAPTYLSISPRGSYLAFFDNTFMSHFSFKGRIDCRFSGGAVRYYMFAGSPEDNVRRYYDLIGHPAMPPRWALGYHQCRWSYMNEAEIREVAEGFRHHKLPVSSIHMDIHYMDGYRVFTVDKSRFPDLRQLAEDLLVDGIRLVTILDPGVKKDPDYFLYSEGLEKDVFLKLPDGSHAESLVWPGWCAFPDFSDPRAREWWASQYKILLDQGISGFWHDMNEPAAFAAWGDCTLPTATLHKMEGRGGSHLEGHNIYALQEAMAGYEGQKNFKPERRPWILSRSGWPGLARYSWHWTGDSESNWWSLAQTLRIAMNMSVSGIPYTGPDIGGFGGRPDKELYLRWFEAASMLPFFRVHSAFFTPRREPWCYDDETTEITRYHLNRRYALLPYWYTLAAAATRTGNPLIRPMYMLDVSMVNVDDQFMVGESLMVAPVVTKGLTERSVRLPEGVWYDWETAETISGGRRIAVNAPLRAMPLFARAGSIVPVSPEFPENDHSMELRVFLPTDDGTFAGGELFRDEGDGWGPWLLEKFDLSSRDSIVTITRRANGEFDPETEFFDLRIIGGDEITEITVDGNPITRGNETFRVPSEFTEIKI